MQTDQETTTACDGCKAWLNVLNMVYDSRTGRVLCPRCKKKESHKGVDKPGV